MENRRRQRKQRNIPSVSGLLFTREWRIQLYLDKTFIIIILINSVIQSVGGDDGDLVSRLQTVMILLEHFENQYCSTPDTTSGSWSSLPPSLPPSTQTDSGRTLSLLRLEDSLRIWVRLRLTETDWDASERVRSSEAADSVWLSVLLSLAQIPVTVCPILLWVAAPPAARLWPAFLSATNTVFSSLWLTLWRRWDYWLHHSHHHHHLHLQTGKYLEFCWTLQSL